MNIEYFFTIYVCEAVELVCWYIYLCEAVEFVFWYIYLAMMN